MPSYLCSKFDDVNNCIEWTPYVPQYILPQLTIPEAIFLGIGFWTILLVAWGITSLRETF